MKSNMNNEQINKAMTTPYLLAALIYRALDRTLLTAPKKKLSKRKMDCSKSKGAVIGSFLKKPEALFPAWHEDDRKKRVEFILLQLEKIGVNLDREFYDIEIEIALLGTTIKNFLSDKNVRKNYLTSETFQACKKESKALIELKIMADSLYETLFHEKLNFPIKPSLEHLLPQNEKKNNPEKNVK